MLQNNQLQLQLDCIDNDKDIKEIVDYIAYAARKISQLQCTIDENNSNFDYINNIADSAVNLHSSIKAIMNCELKKGNLKFSITNVYPKNLLENMCKLFKETLKFIEEISISELETDTLNTRIKEKYQLIRKYDKAYYQDFKPLISDHEYDKLYKNWIAMRKEFCQRIGIEIENDEYSSYIGH